MSAVLRLHLPPDVEARIAVAMDADDDNLAFALLQSASDHQIRGEPVTVEQAETEAEKAMKQKAEKEKEWASLPR